MIEPIAILKGGHAVRAMVRARARSRRDADGGISCRGETVIVKQEIERHFAAGFHGDTLSKER